MLLAIGPMVATTLLFQSLAAPRPAALEDIGIAQTIDVLGVTVLTDRGTPIHVKRLSAAVAPGAVPDGYTGRLIVAGGADALSNCHGWVFTDGEFCVDGARVDDILRENGYTPVVDPQPSDLIVYRDHDGVPMHTGIARRSGLRRPLGVLAQSPGRSSPRRPRRAVTGQLPGAVAQSPANPPPKLPVCFWGWQGMVRGHVFPPRKPKSCRVFRRVAYPSNKVYYS